MEITWTSPALSDLETLATYVRRDSEDAATRLVAKIFSAAESLPLCQTEGEQAP